MPIFIINSLVNEPCDIITAVNVSLNHESAMGFSTVWILSQ